MHKLQKFFSPFCINKTYIHINSKKSFSPFLYKTGKWNKLAYINSKILLPLFVKSSTRGENRSNKKNIYAIHIHEEERREVSSPYIHALHEEGMINPNSHKA